MSDPRINYPNPVSSVSKADCEYPGRLYSFFIGFMRNLDEFRKRVVQLLNAAEEGSATGNANTGITISTAYVTSTSRIYLHSTSAGALFVSARVANTSFTVKSTSASDTNITVRWELFNDD